MTHDDANFILVDEAHLVSAQSSATCHSCRTSLAGCALDGACPGCQAPVSSTIPVGATVVRVDSRGMIAHTWPCHDCGYDLRGLSPDGTCPECRRSIMLSLMSKGIDRSPSSWLRRMRFGLLLLVIYYIAIAVRSIIDRSLSFARGLAPVSHATAVWSSTVPWLGILLFFYTGVWIVTTRAPANTPLSNDNNVRRAARSAALLSLVAVGLTVPPYVFFGFLPAFVSYSRWVIECACSLLLLVYLMRIARAIPARWIERALLVLTVVKVIALGLTEYLYTTTVHWGYAFGSDEYSHQTILSHGTGIPDLSFYRPLVIAFYVAVGVGVLLDFSCGYLVYRMNAALSGKGSDES